MRSITELHLLRRQTSQSGSHAWNSPRTSPPDHFAPGSVFRSTWGRPTGTLRDPQDRRLIQRYGNPFHLGDVELDQDVKHSRRLLYAARKHAHRRQLTRLLRHGGGQMHIYHHPQTGRSRLYRGTPRSLTSDWLARLNGISRRTRRG